MTHVIICFSERLFRILFSMWRAVFSHCIIFYGHSFLGPFFSLSHCLWQEQKEALFIYLLKKKPWLPTCHDGNRQSIVRIMWHYLCSWNFYFCLTGLRQHPKGTDIIIPFYEIIVILRWNASACSTQKCREAGAQYEDTLFHQGVTW